MTDETVLTLRSPSAKANEFSALAREMRVKQGSVLFSAANRREAQAAAWIAINAIGQALEQRKPPADIEILWAKAIDLTREWLRATE